MAECCNPRPLTVLGIKDLVKNDKLSSSRKHASGLPEDDASGATFPKYLKTDIAALLAESQRRCKAHVQRFGTDASSIRRCFVGRKRKVTIDSRVNDDENAENSTDRAKDSEDDADNNDSDVFDYEKDLMKIQAPMVRCSRPPFRKLCRLWGTDIVYTHMILADCFVRSESARQVDFALFAGEDKLITQFAAKSGPTLAQAATIVSPFTDGIDINCGCPQKWAMKDGYGSALLEKPELVADMVSCVTNSGAGVPCVVKMRVYDDLKTSVEFARRAEKAGAAWLTVHGRTPQCTSMATVRHEAIKLIQESVSIPVVANGGARDPESSIRLALESNVGAVMSAQGLLDNPAMFDKESSCFADVIRRGWDKMPTLGSSKATHKPNHSAINVNTEGSLAGVTLPSSSPASAVGIFSSSSTTMLGGGEAAAVSAGLSGSKHYNSASFWDECYEGHFSLGAQSSQSTDAFTGAPLELQPSINGTAVADVPPLACISDFCRLALHTELPYKTTQHHLLMMAHKYLSPAERVYVGEQPSLLGIVEYFRRQGLYVPSGRYVPNSIFS